MLNPAAFSLCSLRLCVESLRINLGLLGICAKPPADGGSNTVVLHLPLQFQRQSPAQPLQLDDSDDAADTPEPTAGFVPFQRQ